MKRKRYLVGLGVVCFLMGLSLISIPGSGSVVQGHGKDPVKDAGLWAIVGPANVYAGTPEKPQALCPITGEPIDRSVHTDFNGKRIYFCCAGCKEPFKKDPEKYIQEMESKGIKLEKAPSP